MEDQRTEYPAKAGNAGILPELNELHAVHGATLSSEPGPRVHFHVRPHSPCEALLRLVALPRPVRAPRPYRGEFNPNTVNKQKRPRWGRFCLLVEAASI